MVSVFLQRHKNIETCVNEVLLFYTKYRQLKFVEISKISMEDKT